MCDRLYCSLKRVNRGQGLGFLMFGSVVNKAKLLSIATTLTMVGPRFTISHPFNTIYLLLNYRATQG